MPGCRIRAAADGSAARAETALVAGLSVPLGEAIRSLVRTEMVNRSTAPHERSGLLIFDERGQLTSANAHAEAWLGQLPTEDLVPTRLGLEVPIRLLLTAIRARESFDAGGDGTARTRVRSRSGRWLACHASTTRAVDGSPAQTAVLIEAASPALIAPIVVEAYGLTEREQEVTRLVARGAGTHEIAATMYLSPHTVKDHIKAILSKVGVSSRGELVAALYAEHYEPVHLGDPVREPPH